MRRACVIGPTGGLAATLAGDLAAQGWAVTRAEPSGVPVPADLLVLADPATDAPQAAALLQAFAAHVPPPEGTPSGPRARAAVVLLLDGAGLQPTGVAPAHHPCQAARLALMRSAALAFAPAVRVNAIAHDPATDPADLRLSLEYLARADAVTGQLIRLSGQRLASAAPPCDAPV